MDPMDFVTELRHSGSTPSDVLARVFNDADVLGGRTLDDDEAWLHVRSIIRSFFRVPVWLA